MSNYRKIIILGLAVLIMFASSAYKSITNYQATSSKPTNHDYEEIIKFTYTENIIKSIKAHYGEDRDFTNLKIKSIETGFLSDTITFEFNTFSGAHNPPYTLDTVSYEVSYQQQKLIIDEIDYKNVIIDTLPDVSA